MLKLYIPLLALDQTLLSCGLSYCGFCFRVGLCVELLLDADEFFGEQAVFSLDLLEDLLHLLDKIQCQKFGWAERYCLFFFNTS